MKGAVRSVRFAWLLLLLSATAAQAQSYAAGGGFRRTGTASLGSAQANQTTGAGQPFALFATDSELAGANAVEGWVGVRLSETLHLEGAGSYGSSELRTRISSDVEGIPDVTAVESVQQYTLEAGVRMVLPQWRVGERTLPFASAGGGYVRYRHEGQTLLEHGGQFHLGAGATIELASRPDARISAIGVRVEGRAVIRVRGIAFDDDPHVVPQLGVSAFVGF
jgi:opacity protein-like surface antigen